MALVIITVIITKLLSVWFNLIRTDFVWGIDDVKIQCLGYKSNKKCKKRKYDMSKPKKAGLFQGSFFCGGELTWPPPLLHVSRRTNLISI